MRIIRHELEITDYQEIRVPEGEFLSVAVSRSAPNTAIDMWTLDKETNPRPRVVAVYVVGTGNPMPTELDTDGKFLTRWPRTFLGTVVTPSGLVWHVFVGPRIEQPK